MFPGKILNVKFNFNPSFQLHNHAKVVVVGLLFDDYENFTRPLSSLDDAVEKAACERNSYLPEILVRHLNDCFLGPFEIEGENGIFILPKTPIRTVRKGGVQMKITCHFAHPANAISCHQSQGARFPKYVATLDVNSERYYGMSNVVTSRTSKPETFALSRKVTPRTMMLEPITSQIVESEYRILAKLVPYTATCFNKRYEIIIGLS